MTERKKPRKPTGEALSVRMRGDGSQEQMSVSFPEAKEEVEEKVFEDFVKALARNDWMNVGFAITAWKLNPTDDFDFLVTTSQGQKSAELMEFAPLEGVQGGHRNAPANFVVSERIDPVVEKIMSKSRRYGPAHKRDLLLVLYTTDWKFLPLGPPQELLGYRLYVEQPNFSHVFLSCSVGGGSIVQVLYPTNGERWEGFDPHAAGNQRGQMLDPKAWKPTDDGGFTQGS